MGIGGENCHEFEGNYHVFVFKRLQYLKIKPYFSKIL